MTITFAWYSLPLIILFFSFIYMVYDFGHASGYLGGLIGTVVFIFGLAVSLGIVLGHFL